MPKEIARPIDHLQERLQITQERGNLRQQMQKELKVAREAEALQTRLENDSARQQSAINVRQQRDALASKRKRENTEDATKRQEEELEQRCEKAEAVDRHYSNEH